MSASNSPTAWPRRARPTARFKAMVDLPTPPLPAPTAMMCLTPGRGRADWGDGGGMEMGRRVERAIVGGGSPRIGREKRVWGCGKGLFSAGSWLAIGQAPERLADDGIDKSARTLGLR